MQGNNLLTPEEETRLQRILALAAFMDTSVVIPGLGLRFGADAVLGLVPGIGDLAGSLVGLYILNEARRLGVPSSKLGKMAINLGVDAACGSIPVVGDLFDAFFKSHRRNAAIVMEHFERDARF